jgi:hypothetical protein
MVYHFITYLLDINSGSAYWSTEKVIIRLLKEERCFGWGVGRA